MYSYEWDAQTGGYLLNNNHLHFSKEPRPVYYKELDLLGFDRYWNYIKDDTYPYMWAEASNYYYRGKLVAKTKGGSLYTSPELILIEEPEQNNNNLRFVDINQMIAKNEAILESLVQNTIKKIYNTFIDYQNKVDVFYVAFSGGKDSVAVLDLVQRALPHNRFKVVFGDTGMEFPDTYDVVEKTKKICSEMGVQFLHANSKMNTRQTWELFGPPSTSNRWCCSVHKTSPQISTLREVTGNNYLTGMAYTGIRGDESVARSEYDDVSLGGKHQGQYSCHPILDWNSAELFLYIYKNNLIINEAYKKGNSRVGCLICPMSSGKHEYIKYQCYPRESDTFVNFITTTSGKTNFKADQMKEFIDAGMWKTRKTGRELNFGQDKFYVQVETNKTKIIVYQRDIEWLEWAKTIGSILKISDDSYSIEYRRKLYEIRLSVRESEIEFSFPNCYTSKDDIKFISLFRGVIVKSLYCIACGVCTVECKNKCISMENGLHISDECIHCTLCHEMHEHCLRYNSIRNKIGADKQMKGLDRYFSFGVRKSWFDTFVRYGGDAGFWESDGDGEVANKKKDAFLNFAKDAGLIVFDKSLVGDKYTKYRPTTLTKVIAQRCLDYKFSWGLMLVNLAYTPQFQWYIKNVKTNIVQTPDNLKMLLSEVMEKDEKGLGKRNIVDAFKIILIKTPLGNELGLGVCNYDEKVSAMGKETITLHSFYRTSWNEVDPRIILYSLFKFAETCGNYYQFTLSRLLNHDIESDGISPTEIFGLDRESMEKILNGLTINYPDYITTSFTLDLDNITLRNDKTSQDVLALF